MHIRKITGILIFYTLIPWGLQAQEPVILEQNVNRYDLGLELEILEDPGGRLSLDDVTGAGVQERWRKSIWKVPNFTFSKSAYWLRFKLRNPTSQPQKMLLELANPLHDYVDVFIKAETRPTRVVRTGDRFPVDSRDIKHRHFIFDLPVQAGETVFVHMRIHSYDGYHQPFPLKLWRKDVFLLEQINLHYFLGVLLGILAIMMVYHLFIFISLRDISYLYYALFLLGILLWLMIRQGFAPLFLWPDSPWWGNQAILVSISFLLVQFYLFTRSYLHTAEYTPKLDLLLRGLVVLTFGFICLAGFGFYALITGLNMLGLTFGPLTSLVAGFIILKRGHRPARYYLLAYVILFGGTIILTLNNAGLIPSNLITENGLLFGLVLMVVLLSLGLADRIKVMRDQNAAAQEHMLDLQKQAAETLELQVQERTWELAQANDKLRNMDRSKTQFFTKISHEFRTPLTLILTPLESIVKGEFGESIQSKNKILSTMLKNSGRLLRLINDLLDFTKVEAGRIAANKQNTDLVKLLNFYKGSVQSGFEARGLQIKFQDKTGGLFAFVDRVLLEKAMMYLLSNAFKFTPAGGVVSIQLSRVDDTYFEISVADTGIGLPEDKLDSIFERFSQADNSGTRKYEGTGIGLSLTKDIVELHGGVIRAENRPSGGAVFSLLIPIGTPADPGAVDEPEILEEIDAANTYLMSEFQAEKTEEQPIRESETLKPYKVLLVEDDVDMRSFLNMLLGRNYEVHFAVNGKQGLERAHEINPDLILSDVMMPEMDGYEMTQELKRSRYTRNIPVILLSAMADVSSRIEGLEFGADDYLPKPFNSVELLIRIRNQIESKKLERALKTEKMERDKDFVQASLVQENILTPPALIKQLHELELEIAYLPMNGQVSGDYYNLSRIDGGIASVFIADATGHGTQAALSTMQIDILYREFLGQGTPPERLYEMNKKFMAEIRSKNFFTGIIVDIFENQITYSSAGHPEQLLIQTQKKQIHRLRTRGGMVGIIEEQTYEMGRMEMDKNDILLFFTDGIFEVFDVKHEEFGEERFFDLIQAGLLAGLFNQPMDKIVESILSNLDDFRGEEPFSDDITLIGIRLK